MLTKETPRENIDFLVSKWKFKQSNAKCKFLHQIELNKLNNKKKIVWSMFGLLAAASKLKWTKMFLLLSSGERLVGMQHLVECVCDGPPEKRYYLCTLCNLTLATHMIIKHVLSFDHIFCYFVSKSGKKDSLRLWLCEHFTNNDNLQQNRTA